MGLDARRQKMSIRSVALLIGVSLLVPQAGALPQEHENAEKKPDNYGKDVASFATGMLEIYTGLVAKGYEVWDRLGNMQAASVLDDIATAAGDQAKANEILLARMKESVKNNNTRDLFVSVEVSTLHRSLERLGKQLTRFAAEVDQAAPPIGEEARVKFAIAEAGKTSELDAIVRSWEAGRFDEAMEHLKKAQQYMDVMRKIIRCLQDSVKAKKPACDPKQFPMPDDEKKRVA
jgi:hypothetical protein